MANKKEIIHDAFIVNNNDFEIFYNWLFIKYPDYEFDDYSYDELPKGSYQIHKNKIVIFTVCEYIDYYKLFTFDYNYSTTNDFINHYKTLNFIDLKVDKVTEWKKENYGY